MSAHTLQTNSYFYLFYGNHKIDMLILNKLMKMKIGKNLKSTQSRTTFPEIRTPS